MGISRDSQHKRRLTGGKKPKHHKKRKHELGRQMAMTKIARSASTRCVAEEITDMFIRIT